jgi:Xaa-Pro aminopeptidase
MSTLAHHHLEGVRRWMQQHGLHAYLLPVNDAFFSEYPPASERRLEWLTGFSGSAGMLAITAQKARLFVDGRYTLQAANEVDSHFFEVVNSASLQPEVWLRDVLSPGMQVGLDPTLFSIRNERRIRHALKEVRIATLSIPENPIDLLWQDRPAPPHSQVEVHPITYSGKIVPEKRTDLSCLLQERHAHALFIAAPDSVNWLLNIRGRDVPHTPIAQLHAMLYMSGEVALFAESDRIPEDVREHLGGAVHLHDPSELQQKLADMAGERVWVDDAHTSAWIKQMLKDVKACILYDPDPCQAMKAVKNPIELEGMRNAHRRDGVALTRFLHWLEQQVTAGAPLSELSVAERLEAFRREDPLLRDLSFPTIAGFGANGAIVHYRASEASNQAIRAPGLLLLDSGGQYLNGTTDVTRTIAIGTPSEEQKHAYTTVLKGHIQLAMAIFPQGTCGSQLDVLARDPLWRAGMDYDHGTGHGVGCYLSVHEGPQRISKRGGDAPLEAGMILSNEPGYYREGAFGIRIENLVSVVPAPLRGFLAFETLTLAPLDLSLILSELLSPEEKRWVRDYHQRVYSLLADHLPHDTAQWLEQIARRS